MNQSMNEVLLQVSVFGMPIRITAWKLVGYAGVLIFAGRWIVQIIASHMSERSSFPRLFWYMSLAGSLLLIAYFTFGKNDSVGILSNLLPAGVAGYNLALDMKHKRMQRQAATGA